MIFVWNLWLFGWHLRKTSFYEEFYSQNLATFRSIKFYGIGPSDTTDVLTECANIRKIKINFFRENCRVEYILNFFNRCSTELERDGIWEIHTLLIKDISMDDGGNFNIKATNRVGTTEESGSLAIVTEEPSFPKSLESVTTKLGCTESFEVQIELIFLSK